MQGAGLELGHLAIFRSGGFGTEIETFRVLFFVNEMRLSSRAALRRILSFPLVFSEARRAPLGCRSRIKRGYERSGAFGALLGVLGSLLLGEGQQNGTSVVREEAFGKERQFAPGGYYGCRPGNEAAHS
jgi:hypothetical protein